MRLFGAILACLGSAALTTVCLADPPASAAAATSQPATPATSSTPASAPAPAATSHAAAPATTPTSSAAAKPAPTLDADEKQLMNAGYTPEMHNGTKLWCRREQEIGSRLGSRQKTCGTAEELAVRERAAQDQFQQQQAASSVIPSSGGMPGR